MPPAIPPVQSFHSYDQLARLWPVARSTISKWVADLRHDRPDLVWLTYRLVNGHQRTAFLAGATVAELQRRHFPHGTTPPKRRGLGRQGTPWRVPVLPPSPTPPPASVVALPRRLVLPTMPRRDPPAPPLLPRSRSVMMRDE